MADELHPAEIKKLELEAALLEHEIRRTKAEAASAELTYEIEQLEAEECRHKYVVKAAHYDRHRRFSFFGGVTGSSVAECIGELQFWHRQDPTCAIEIVLNSPGGDVLHGLALYDDLLSLREAGHEITIRVRGMAASMGGILLQAASPGRRIIGENAHVLIHEISTGAVGKLSEIEDEAKFCEQLSARLLNILAERSTLTPQQIKRRWRRKDWWLGADEAIALGFADTTG